MKKIVWLDFDDFGETNHRLDWLWLLRKDFPNFKVNMFAIPSENTNKEWMKYINSLDWIQMCVHGFNHKHNEDVPEKKLKVLPAQGYAKVYRAPFWQLSDDMYERLTKLGYKVMLEADDKRVGIKYNWNVKDTPPLSLKIIYGHGHVQDYNYDNGPKGNGIVQAFENIMKLPKDTEFKFL